MKKTTVISILIGTILEWYDFSLLGSMSPIISTLFFPSKSPLLSLLSTFVVFATGFVLRPIGGVIFGHIGDRYGRKIALSMTIFLMAVPTTLIGLLPTFSTVGIFAPIILVILRLVQGLASSGEYPGAICFLTETAPQSKKGFWGSISMFGVAGGVLLCSLITTALSIYISNEQMYSWGWRIPFLIGLPLGIVGWYLRYKISESSAFQSALATHSNHKLPINQIIRYNLVSLHKVILLFALSTTSFYLGFIYIISYLVGLHVLTLQEGLLSNSISTLVLILFIPMFGYLSDRIKRKFVILSGATSLLILSYPIFKMFLSHSLYGLLQGQLLLAFCIAMLAGPMAAATSELFSTLTRYSGVSVGLNIGASVFGGACPLVATVLVNYSGNAIMPCVYPIILAFFCIFIILRFQSRTPTTIN